MYNSGALDDFAESVKVIELHLTARCQACLIFSEYNS